MTESANHLPITETHYCYCHDCRMKAKEYLDKWADMIFSETVCEKKEINSKGK